MTASPKTRPGDINDFADISRRLGQVISQFATKRAAAKAAGVSYDSLLSYEKAENVPNIMAVFRLCISAGVSLDWLATGDGPVLAQERQVVAPQGPREFDAAEIAALGQAIRSVQSALRGQSVDPEAQARLIGDLFRANLGTIRARNGE